MWKEIIENINVADYPLDRISEKKKILDSLRPLPQGVLDQLRQDIALEWTYNSNSIEGNTLTLVETKLVLEDGLTVGGKSLREHFEALNHSDAISYLEQLVSPQYQMNGKDILDVHALVLDKIQKEIAGRYRTGAVRIMGANFVPPNYIKVPDLMDDLMDFTNSQFAQMDSVILSAIFHHRFVWIHPFADGNGRSARLLFNLLLMNDGYPPAIILKNDRKKYYAALNQANNGNYSKFILLVCQAVERSLDIYLSHFDQDSFDYTSIGNLVEEEMTSGYSQEYVSLLARLGKIDAYKEGRIWYTSKKAIDTYIEKRERKRVRS